MTDRTDHRREAERLLTGPEDGERACLAAAQVHALLAIHDTLTDLKPKPVTVTHPWQNPLTVTHPWPSTLPGVAADRYATNEAKQREDEPDPLDETDHRDRLDREGYIIRRKGHECLAWPEFLGFHDSDAGEPLSSINYTAGPLTLAPDPLDENDHRDRLDGYGRIVRRKGHERWAWLEHPKFNGGREGWAWLEFPRSNSEHAGWSLSRINSSDGPLTFAPEEDPASEEAEQQGAPEPDPLDETDHRDRIDADGDRITRRGEGHWHHWDVNCACVGSSPAPLVYFDGVCGPLTFAPEAA